MPDKYDNGPADRERINADEDWQLSYWCATLGVSRELLKQTIERVGPQVSDVKRTLGVG